MLPLYTALLDTSEYGTFDLLITYATLLLPLVNWQFDQGLFRHMLDRRGKPDAQTELFSTVIVAVTAQCGSYAMVFIILSPFLSISHSNFLLYYVILQVYVGVLLQFVRGLGKKYQVCNCKFYISFFNRCFKCYHISAVKMGTNRTVYIHLILPDFNYYIFDTDNKVLAFFFCQMCALECLSDD